MGIESTKIVKKSDAIDMLSHRNVTVYSNDCNERLSDLLYDNSENIFENYQVVDDDYVLGEFDKFKTCW